jgi:hypothetical protein
MSEYLGDGLYVEFDGFQFRLYASDGIHVTNEVYLEPSVLAAVIRFINRTKEQQQNELR